MINLNKKKIFLFGFLIGAFLLKASFALAIEETYPSILGFSLPADPTLPEYAKYFFNAGIGIAGLLAVLTIVFGGAYYLLDMGLGRFKDESKEWIKSGILGLAIVMCSYLIAYTINPNLVIFKLNGLDVVGLWGTGSGNVNSSIPRVYYEVIPIGRVTENLVAKTMDCFDFDVTGDPIGITNEKDSKGNAIPAEQVTVSPANKNHDIADCLLKLSEAVKKKMVIAENLGKKMVEMMNSEECKCSKAKSCTVPDNAWEGKCLPDFLVGQTCPNSACEADAKCFCNDVTCGNDEYTCPDIVKTVKEGKIKINVCCEGEEDCTAEKEYLGLMEFKNDPNKPNIEEEDTGNVYINSWKKLRLIDQIEWLNGEISAIKSQIALAKSTLIAIEKKASNCYAIKSQADFSKIYEQTNEKDKLIMKKGETPLKYCAGFEYDKNSYYQTCQKICPGYSQEDLQCYGQCEKCDNDNLKCSQFDPIKQKDKYKDCVERRTTCLKTQSSCVKKCWDKRSCVFPVINTKNTASDNDDEKITGFKDFQGCMSYYKTQCLETCSKKYLPCSAEYRKCVEDCNIDSQCLIKYEEQCVIGSTDLAQCNTKSNLQDTSNLKFCIERSSLCAYGSDQYAGYEDCLKPNFLGGKYSSSFLYKYPLRQKCQSSNDLVLNYSEEDDEEIESWNYCLDEFPEASKCPSASKCPDCPCGIIGQYNYGSDVVEGSGGCGEYGRDDMKTCKTSDGSTYNACDCPTGGAGSSSSTAISDSTYLRVVIGQCGKYSYSSDPLTFYCQDSWWNNPAEKTDEPLGDTRYCSKKDEIPVGQTVDDAEQWANEFVEAINKLLTTTNSAINYLKRIEKEKDYCKCDSTCGDGKNPCNATCSCAGAEQSTTDATTTGCNCVRGECSGNACQKMINLIKGKTMAEGCPEGFGMDGATASTLDFQGIGWFSFRIGEAINDYILFVNASKRSDILKELDYSRNKMDQCSVTSLTYGTDTKTLNCQRTEHEIIPPIKPTEGTQTIIKGEYIKNHCYGATAGKISGNSSLMDNWFCCQEWETGESGGGSF